MSKKQIKYADVIYELVETEMPTNSGVKIKKMHRADDEQEAFTKEDALAAAEKIDPPIDWDDVDFTPEQLAKGMTVELEHGTENPQTDIIGDDPVLAAKTALAHLYEFSDYYERLDEMEAEAESARGKEGGRGKSCGCGRSHKSDATEEDVYAFIVDNYNKLSRENLVSEVDKLVLNNSWLEKYGPIETAEEWVSDVEKHHPEEITAMTAKVEIVKTKNPWHSGEVKTLKSDSGDFYLAVEDAQGDRVEIIKTRIPGRESEGDKVLAEGSSFEEAMQQAGLVLARAASAAPNRIQYAGKSYKLADSNLGMMQAKSKEIQEGMLESAIAAFEVLNKVKLDVANKMIEMEKDNAVAETMHGDSFPAVDTKMLKSFIAFWEDMYDLVGKEIGQVEEVPYEEGVEEVVPVGGDDYEDDPAEWKTKHGAKRKTALRPTRNKADKLTTLFHSHAVVLSHAYRSAMEYLDYAAVIAIGLPAIMHRWERTVEHEMDKNPSNAGAFSDLLAHLDGLREFGLKVSDVMAAAAARQSQASLKKSSAAPQKIEVNGHVYERDAPAPEKIKVGHFVYEREHPDMIQVGGRVFRLASPVEAKKIMASRKVRVAELSVEDIEPHPGMDELGEEYNIPIKAFPDVAELLMQYHTGQGDPLYALASRINAYGGTLASADEMEAAEDALERAENDLGYDKLHDAYKAISGLDPSEEM